MGDLSRPGSSRSYGLDIRDLSGHVTASRNGQILARSERARVMYETRLPPAVYFPKEDVLVDLGEPTDLQTFCPFKGTAHYHDLALGQTVLPNALWTYGTPLADSRRIDGYVAFMPAAGAELDLGLNTLTPPDWGHISSPVVDWLLREAGFETTPAGLTAAFAHKVSREGLPVSRISVLIWSLHPLIAGKNFVWDRDGDQVQTYAPTWEVYDHPAFVNSPMRHVSEGRGGVRQRLEGPVSESSFPIIEELRAKGATDYVAMPLPFSDGQMNVLALSTDRPGGFSTADLGLLFECVVVISRYFEVFNLRENAKSLLETYVGKRSGARVLGGEVRRGDGDEIDAAILFCDLRDSTSLGQDMRKDAYIRLLNHFFETTSDAIDSAGGEVLKFIGDAVLAVFPVTQDQATACAAAMAASRDIVRALSLERGDLACDCAIGVEFGRVTYGNVGSRERLDFTVIGQAANVAARLCDASKSAGYPILASQAVAENEQDAEDLGGLELRNVSEPVRVRGIRVAAG